MEDDTDNVDQPLQKCGVCQREAVELIRCFHCDELVCNHCCIWVPRPHHASIAMCWFCRRRFQDQDTTAANFVSYEHERTALTEN